MRASRPHLLLLAITTGCVPVAGAQTVPPALGADLLRSCNALIAYAKDGGNITADATSCAAYLKGLRDGVEEVPPRSVSDKPFCAAGAALDDMARTIVKHFQENAESTRKRAVGEAFTALNRAYPCLVKK